MAVKKTFDFFLQPLLKKFFQDMGRDPNNLEMILIRQKAGQLLKDSNKVIQFPQKESFMQQVERMKKSGDIVNLNNLKKNDNVLTREMFQNSNLNKAKPTIEEFDLEKGLDDLDNFRVTKDAAAAKKAIDAERAKEIEPVNERFVDYTIYDIKTKEPTEGKKIVTKIIKREGEYKDLTGIQARRILEETDDHIKGKNKPEDKADGGRIGFRAGKFVLDKVIANLLKDKKKVQQAADDIFGTGDYKMDAQMAAEALVENNPRIFKNKLYDDLDLDTQLEIYGAVLEPVQNKLSMAIKMKRASRPEKTLAAMKEGKGIDMSDPDIADEFTRFMKETDPQGSKKLEQTVELSNFDPKGRKKNAKGGRIGLFLGGNLKGGYSESRTDSGGKQTTVSFEGGDRNNNDLPPPPPPSETVGIETVIENDFNPNKFKNYFAANNNLNFQNYLDFQNRFNLLGTDKTYDEYIEMIDDDKTLNPFQEEDMYEKGQEILQQHKNNMLDFEKPYNEKPGVFINPEQRRYRMAAKTGGRAEYYTGGIADIEPSLDDIGHGSDSLMARTRLMSPGNQATTSTGLNYLLAEDNDNLRVPFKVGGSGRRDFLKLLATLGGGIAGIKSGLFGMGGKEATKKAVTETVKQTAGKYPPPYFFKLVDKIKFMGDDITEKAATKDREIVKKYKDFEMSEDLGTGEIVIKKRNEGAFYDQDGIISDEYIVYKPGKADEATKMKTVDEYEEFTVRPDADGKLKDSEDGLDSIDEILEEVGDPDSMTLKKAEGGRIGFAGGKLATFLADKTITGSSRRFLEKIFGKGSLDEMLKRDPNMHRGMLEVVEMFRKRDKEGLKMYMQKFLPHMDDETVEAFIRGDAEDAAGLGKYGLDNIQGQLIRLGSGRDYAEKIELLKKADNMKKLNALDVKDRKPNASGGVAKLLGE